MVYYSKKDGWLISFLIGTLALSLLVGFYFIFVGNNVAGYRWLLACSVAGFLVLLFAYPLHYTIGDTELLIRSGVTLRQIPLDTIEEVSPVRDISSSPAWSIDRLSILYMKKGRPVYIYISPAQKLEFQQELERKVPHLQQSGERLVRTAALV